MPPAGGPPHDVPPCRDTTDIGSLTIDHTPFDNQNAPIPGTISTLTKLTQLCVAWPLPH